MLSPISVRRAVKDDMPSVLELIRELARYEKAEEQVKNSVAGLVADGFGDQPSFQCIVAEHDGNIIGFALCYNSYSTWRGKCLYLEDICVTEAYRRKGVGSLLFEAVKGIAQAQRVKRLEWQVLEWNEPALNFYRKYYAHLDPEWINGKLFFD
jgi:GNAT superfamily N-acetyltransferase